MSASEGVGYWKIDVTTERLAERVIIRMDLHGIYQRSIL